ncbi:MAG TPA: FMN-binding protein [Phycisphaerae bacterium]|nr:FMN-binding protein [Phycisphaerae bacterium]
MRRDIYTALYAAVLGTVCALLLTAASVQLKPYQQANRKAERVRNILGVLDVPFDKKAPWAELEGVYRRNVRIDGNGANELYNRIDPEGEVLSVGVPLSGRGRNGPIQGFLALAPDMRTIRGITFYEHEETPGLGGEIENEQFRKKFIGKRIAGEGRIGIRITRPGGAAGDGQVDGITGATMTCRRVERMLNDRIGVIVAEAGHGG